MSPDSRLTDPRKTTIFPKFLGFYATGRQGLHQELFGFPTFRVLTVAKGTQRMQNMMLVAMYATGGHAPNQFLFTDQATLTRYAGDILRLPWRTGAGETTTLGG
jgi:hypothetical protein